MSEARGLEPEGKGWKVGRGQRGGVARSPEAKLQRCPIGRSLWIPWRLTTAQIPSIPSHLMKSGHPRVFLLLRCAAGVPAAPVPLKTHGRSYGMQTYGTHNLSIVTHPLH
ncbi:hypothetical protein PVAG01_06803 [Phlyctema vagabunda]|uniref:Uncharacterized protein n=1 Tax=Phlyctema vagabunda TaxID=108571 RepID=A0ABR4PHS7_9HELO